MYWLLDVLMILLIVAALLLGYRRGIVNMLATTFAVLLLLVFGIAGAAGFLLLLYKVGAVDNLGYMLLNVFGETNSLFSLIGITSFDVCQIVSALILFLLAAVISGAIFVAAGWGLKKLCDKIPNNGVFGIISGSLGAIIYLAIVLAFFWAITGLFYALAQNGGAFSQDLCNFFESCQVSGWLFKINPIKELFAQMFA